MSDSVDELFGEGRGAPRPRVTTVLVLLGAGLFMVVLGFGCTVLPGALVVMAGWMTIETEMDRVDNGYLPLDARPVVVRLRNATRAVVLATGLLVVAQIVLVQMGLYDFLLQMFVTTVPSPFVSPEPPTVPVPGTQ